MSQEKPLPRMFSPSRPAALASANGPPQIGGRLLVAAADEDEGMADADGIAGEHHPLHQGIGVGLQQDPVLVGSRLHLVAVADQPARPRQIARHERPLLAGGKAGPAPAAQAGVDDRLLHFSRRQLLQRLLQRRKPPPSARYSAKVTTRPGRLCRKSTCSIIRWSPLLARSLNVTGCALGSQPAVNCIPDHHGRRLAAVAQTAAGEQG